MAAIVKTIRPLSEKERRLLNSALGWRKRRVKALRRRTPSFGLTLFVIFSGMMIVATVLDKKGPAWY
jgi:hypothetical protein